MITPDPSHPPRLHTVEDSARAPGGRRARLPGWLVVGSWILLPAVLVLLLAGWGSGLLAGVAGSGTPVAPPTALIVAESPLITPTASGDSAAIDTVVPTPAALAPDPADSPPSTLLPVDATALAVLEALPATVPLPSDTPVPPPSDTPVPPPDTPTEVIAPPTDTPPPVQANLDPLTGLPASPAALARVPLTVMIDNHPDAAPQTGLNSADLVYEALAEGGITRFMAVFTTQDPGTIGPVRSARPYYLEWARPFHSLYVHCGGSWEAIDLLKEWTSTLTDVDCFNGNMPFWRSNDRLLPHNLYTSSTDLWKLASRKGLAAPAAMPGFLHAPEAPPADRPSGGSVGFTFSGLSRSDVQWIYDPDGNQYLRKQWGYWHRDLATNDIITAKNVAIIFAHVWELPGDEKGRMGTDTTGRNTELILSNGQFEWGYWTRASINAPLVFLDGKEQPMRFAPGNLWVEALGIGHKLDIHQP
jgi:hypothetical protein